MGYSLGIDFGTSTTKVALRMGNEIPQPLPIGGKGDYFMPSTVAYQRTKGDMAEPIAVGEDALDIPETDHINVVREVKRCLAAAESTGELPQGRYPWWDSKHRCIRLWSRRFTPHEVVLRILEEALERAMRRARELGFGADVDKFTIRGLPIRLGCSVTAGLEARRLLSEVARRLGFPEFKTRNLSEEPVLASLSYVHLEQVIPGETILVYDLGGGTFDTSIVKVHQQSATGAPVLTVFSADGKAFCGGADIDEALFEYLVLKLAENFGFTKDKILGLMDDPNDKQVLRNQARIAKEILSSVEETPIALPPGFLGEAGITLAISRTDLESIVRRSGLMERTLECVLRCWCRARMLLRKQGEAIATYYLEDDRSSGRIGGSVFKLDHQDLRENVQRILVVGGATRMPLIRQELASRWGAEKLISEDVVKPVEAASIGAAWQREEIGAVVDRLPFSVVLCSEAGEQELYRAFTPTVMYDTRRADPRIYPFTSAPVSLPVGCEEAVIVLRNADGDVIPPKHPLSRVPSGEYFLEVDLFGRCSLKDNAGVLMEFPNPCQHPLQKELWERMEGERRREEQEQRRRTHETLYRSPFLENE